MMPFTTALAGGSAAKLTAFDRRSGAVRWTAGIGGFFMSPIIVTMSGARQLVTVTQSAVIGVDVASGRLLWDHPWKGGRLGGITPVVREGVVIVSASQSGVTAIRPVRRGATWAVESVWDTADVSMYISNPVVIDGVLYGLSERNGGQLFALDARSGTLLWRGLGREGAHASFVKAGTALFVLKDNAELIVARPTREALNVLARYTVADTATWAQPVVSGRRILVKDVSHLTIWTTR
jgi:outer membrane protein assembly factor BamB